MTTRRHRSDEDVVVGRVGLHPDPVTEDRAAAERRARVDREHRDTLVTAPHLADEGAGQRRLPGARRAGQADRVGRVGTPGVRSRSDGARRRAAPLDHRQEAGERAPVPVESSVDELVGITTDGHGSVMVARRHRSSQACGSAEPPTCETGGMVAVLLAHGNNLDEILIGGVPILLVIALVTQSWRKSRAIEAGDD